MENASPHKLEDLLALMRRLRSPIDGCPWDVEQDFKSIKQHTIEEAYEVADAIEREDMDDLKDELGDLLFQVVFHAQMAQEADLFCFDDIIDHVTKKMIFRHPHVFENIQADTADSVKNNVWEQQKDKEKKGKTDCEQSHYLDRVTRALPSLSLANKVQKYVQRTGFKYDTIDDVFLKMDEEILELKNAIHTKNNKDIEEEYGDVLFATALLARYIETEKTAEDILRQSCLKFITRFNAMEDHLKSDNKELHETSIDELMAAWETIKNTQKL